MKVPRRTVLKGAVLLMGACHHRNEEQHDDSEKHDDPEKDESDDMSNFQLLQDVRPVTLRASSIITANSDAEVNAAPLTNGSGEPMEIHEFIFSVRPTQNAIENYGSVGLLPTGGQFALGLSVKDENDSGYAITNGVIPLWSFGQARQLGQEERLQYVSRNVINLFDGAFLTSVYSWKLDHPLYVPPGGRIVPVTRALGSFGGDVEIGITAIGKILPSSPTKSSLKVPWVCAYVSKSFDLAAAGTDTSTDNSLYNPFPDKPVVIERFVGRLHCISTFDVTVGLTTVPQVIVYDTSALTQIDTSTYYNDGYIPNSYFSRLLKIKMRDSMGNPIVREKTLFRSVFESATRTWEVRQVLPPKQFHKIDFYKDLTEATSTRSTRLQASVASVGWREVNWRVK